MGCCIICKVTNSKRKNKSFKYLLKRREPKINLYLLRTGFVVGFGRIPSVR